MSDTQQFKTPVYIRNSTKAYYNRVRNDPEKYQIYLDQKKIYNDKESSIEDKEKAMNILLSHYLKRVD